MELIFNSCGEVRRAQLVKSTLLTSMLARWCPWDLFRSSKVCSDAKERVGCGKQWEATAPIQTLVKLQPWFLSLQWKTYFWQNYSLGSCNCTEGPALGQKTLMMITRKRETKVNFFCQMLFYSIEIVVFIAISLR